MTVSPPSAPLGQALAMSKRPRRHHPSSSEPPRGAVLATLRAYESTCGQPWLINALGREVIEERKVRARTATGRPVILVRSEPHAEPAHLRTRPLL